MSVLLKKELRAQRPFVVLIAFIALLNLCEFLAGKYPDTRSIGEHLNEHANSGEVAVIYLVLAMCLALALLPREKDEGTLEFLDGLPCTRSQIFAAKALTGILILGLYPLFDNATGVILHWLGHSSIDPPWPWRLFGTMTLLEWWLGIALLGVGLLLSFFRRFSFFVIGLLFAGYLALDTAGVSWVQRFDFPAVVRYTFPGLNSER
jgi:ABC-type transport system involved in multi-copper enzyme maturation permease subunit